MTANRSSDPSPDVVGRKFFAALWAVGTVPLALLLLVVADTWSGRLFGTTALLTGLLPLLLVIAWSNKQRLWRRGTLSLALLWVVGFSLVLFRAPSGTAAAQSRVRHVYAGGQSHFSRYALGNLLPECDQLLLGFTLVPIVDPLFTTGQSLKLKRMTREIYRELENDPDFHALGSVMPETYADLFGSPARSGHSFVYVPPGMDRTKPHPVLVFFHGSGGNFKAYLWILSKVADQQGLVLVAPTDGMGNWRGADSRVAFDKALEAAASIAALDRRRIHVIGLSNGGRAASQVAAAKGPELRSLIFVSPVFDADEIQGGAFAESCHGKSVLVITGGVDDRVPLSYVLENAARMRRAGARVQLYEMAGFDHFLIFSLRAEVPGMLESWLTENN